MPRSKRTLAETDPNVDAAPAAQRASTAKTKKTDKPSTMHKEKKTTASTSSKFASIPKDQTSISVDAPSSEDDKSWVYICNPDQNTCGDKDTCVCGKPADENTAHHKWIVTKKGHELATEWRVQKGKRDQDVFGMYIFNDWTGYGICEVIENMFLAFNKETKKKNRDPLGMWSHVEGMALFLNDDIAEWHMFHDSEGNAKRTMLIGTALLLTLDILGDKRRFEHALLDVRNAGLIIGRLLNFAQSMTPSCRLNENGWKSKVLEKAHEFDIIIEGSDFESVLAEIRKTEHCKGSDEEGNEQSTTQYDLDNITKCMQCYKSRPRGGVLPLESLRTGIVREWRYWLWSFELEAYSQFQSVKVGPGCGPAYGGRIGGKFYDLTAQRNKGGHMKQYRLSEGAW